MTILTYPPVASTDIMKLLDNQEATQSWRCEYFLKFCDCSEEGFL